jgi:DNA repair exonuclease SbcCD ATPase subunit
MEEFTMTNEQNHRLRKMEDSVEEIKTDISTIKTALLGNEFSKDLGLVSQIAVLKTEIGTLKAELRVLQDDKKVNTGYIKILGIVSTALIMGAVKLIFFS